MRLSSWLIAAAVAVLWTVQIGASSPRIAGKDYVYTLQNHNTNETCLYASFRMSFLIQYESESGSNAQTLSLPARQNLTDISGYCLNSNETESELILKWNNSYTLSLKFKRGRKWYLHRIGFTFNLSSSVFTNLTAGNGFQMFLTEGEDLFNRTFRNNEYFYCERCKMYNFYHINQSICDDCVKPCVNNSKNETVCSNVHMTKSVIYIKDPSDGKKRLCLEDYIALQEIIVPIVVGGVLGILLVLIFIAYVIAYARRRRREAKYEPVGDY